MKNESGFSLVELLVVLGLTAMLALGGAVAIFHILRVSNQNSDWGKVIHETGTVGYWIGHDLPMADEISADDPATPDTELLTLVWKDWETGAIYNIHYAISGPPASLKQIERRVYVYQVIDGDNVVLESKAITIAGNIYNAEITQEGALWKLSVESRSGSRSLVHEYEMYSRLNYLDL